MFSVGSVESAFGATSSAPALAAPWPERIENRYRYTFRSVNLGGSACTLQTNAGGLVAVLALSLGGFFLPKRASHSLGERRQGHHDTVSVRSDKLEDESDASLVRSILDP